MTDIDVRDLHRWCSVPVDELAGHPGLKVPFRLVEDSARMGEVMARELADGVAAANARGAGYRAIVPCGPKSWYEPFARIVNAEGISLRRLTVFHMDECLDWECRPLPAGHPYNFRAFMERFFYAPVRPELSVPEAQRVFPEVSRITEICRRIDEAPIDLTLGGWGQDGHVAYNQARRHPYSAVTVEQLRASRLRVQENNWDTVIALAARSFGAAWQFVPPMSITLGLHECLSARKVRLFSDTGSWKQTALRVALFSDPTPEYPMTLLQSHPDALITATRETASHPIAENPDWELLPPEDGRHGRGGK
jgi:glucosamine-6-phosphate deaminase